MIQDFLTHLATGPPWGPMHRGCPSCSRVSSTKVRLTGDIWCQVEAELLPAGKDNPWGNAFVKKETDLVDESTSGRVVDCLKARFWKIKNPTVCHEYSGRPSATVDSPAYSFTGSHPCSALQQCGHVDRLCKKHSCYGSFGLLKASTSHATACHGDTKAG